MENVSTSGGLTELAMTPLLLGKQNGPFFEPPHFQCKNTLFIGCGGMGTSVVNCLKKRLLEYTDTHRFKGMRFLALDTAQQDRGTQKSYLEEGEIRRTYSEDLIDILNNVQRYPEIAEWFRTDRLTRTIKEEIYNCEDGAGTTRAFGRVSFFDKAASIESVLKNLTIPPEAHGIRGKHGEVIQVNRESFHIYVVASLCGGTGAGTFLDVAAMLRYLQAQSGVGGGSPWHIFGVFILPEVICADPRVTQHSRLWANGYACLKELDHFLSGHDFQVKYSHWDQPLLLSNRDYDETLYNMVYLVDRTDSSELTSRDDVSEVVAEYLFYHTFTQGNVDYFNRYIDKRAKLEFRQLHPENDRGGNQHMTLYSAMAVNTVYIPINELVAHCNYRLALDTFKHLCFAGTEETEQRVQALWQGDPLTGLPPLLERLQLDENRLSAMFGFRLDSRGRYVLQGRLQEFANQSCGFIAAMAGALAEHGRQWWRLWQRRVDVQGIRTQLDTGAQNLRGMLARFEEEPDFFPDHREMVGYKDGLARFRQSLLGDDLQVGVLRRELEAIMNQEGATVARELMFDLREALVQYTTIPALEARPFQPQTSPNLDRNALVQHLQSLATQCRDLVSAWLVRGAMRKRVAFVGRLLRELERIERDFEHISSNLRDMRKCFENRLNRVRFTSNKWRKSAIDRYKADDVYQNYFIPALPRHLLPRNLARAIREDGLEIEDAGVQRRLFLDDFGNYPPEMVADALISRVFAATDLQLDPQVPIARDAFAGDHRRLWLTSFETIKTTEDGSAGIFTDTPAGGDEIERITQILKEGADWHLSFNYTQGVEYSLCFAGSQAGRQDWQTVLGTEVNQLNHLRTMHYNQVTLLRSYHGIPVSTIDSLAKWREVYELYVFAGWPLHLFKDAEDWQEPYPEPYQRDNPDRLFEIAVERGVFWEKPGGVVGGGAGGETREYDVWGVDSLQNELYTAREHMEEYKLAYPFCAASYQPRHISRDEFLCCLEASEDFRNTLIQQLKKPEYFNLLSDAEVTTRLMNESFQLTRQQLINAGLEAGLIDSDRAGYLHFSLRTRDESLDKIFFDVRHIRKYLTRNELINLLRTSTVFYEYVLWEIIEAIMADEEHRQAARELLEQHFYPSDLHRELTDFLG